MSQRNRANTRAQSESSQRERPSFSHQHDMSYTSENVSHDNANQLYTVAACRYILAMSNHKLPIKCSEVVKHCMNGESKLYPVIFKMAAKLLSELYGLETHEIRDDKSVKVILCTSDLIGGSELEYTQQRRVDLRLLVIVLSYIHMKGGTVAETTLYGFLNRLDICNEPHETFGHFKKKISETFIRQMYLRREKVAIEGGNAEDKINYSWGLRAQLEMSNEKVAEAVAKIVQAPANALTGESEDSEDENGVALETSDIDMNE